MKKMLAKIAKPLMTPLRWLSKTVLAPPLVWLKNKLDGKKILKEEFRKIGLVLMGLGLSGYLINDREKLVVFLVPTGFIFWTVGMLEDKPKGENDVPD